MKTLTIKWSLEDETGKAFENKIILTDAEGLNRHHRIWKAAMDMLRIGISETLDEKFVGIPPLDIDAALAALDD